MKIREGILLETGLGPMGTYEVLAFWACLVTTDEMVAANVKESSKKIKTDFFSYA